MVIRAVGRSGSRSDSIRPLTLGIGCHAALRSLVAVNVRDPPDLRGRGIGYQGIRGSADRGVLSTGWCVWFAGIVAGAGRLRAVMSHVAELQVTAGTGVSAIQVSRRERWPVWRGRWRALS